MSNALRFWTAASAPFVLGMWQITVLLLAVTLWCGLELARARRIPKIPLATVVGGSALMLLLPLFATTIEALRLFTALYVWILVCAIALAAPYRRALAGVSLLLVWVNMGTLWRTLLWGL